MGESISEKEKVKISKKRIVIFVILSFFLLFLFFMTFSKTVRKEIYISQIKIYTRLHEKKLVEIAKSLENVKIVSDSTYGDHYESKKFYHVRAGKIDAGNKTDYVVLYQSKLWMWGLLSVGYSDYYSLLYVPDGVEIPEWIYTWGETTEVIHMRGSWYILHQEWV